MGREARCAATWGASSGEVTVLLESHELIVRGAFRARASIASLANVRAEGEALSFVAHGDDVTFDLGAKRAQAWASAMLTAPPSLAKKLGIVGETRVHLIGDVDDEALRTALAAAATCDVNVEDADLALVRTDDAAVVECGIARIGAAQRFVPMWIVYRKGARAPLGETRLRALMRDAGWIDTKVAAVSTALSALRFVFRKEREAIVDQTGPSAPRVAPTAAVRRGVESSAT